MYTPRIIKSKSTWVDIDNIKIYTVSIDNADVDQSQFLERLAIVKNERVVDWAITPAFVIFHKGVSYIYLVLAWWGNDNELFNSVSVLTESGWVEDSSKFSFCLFDLEIFWGERNIYIDTIYNSKPSTTEFITKRVIV